MQWKIIRSPPMRGQSLMDKDAFLLKELKKGDLPLLHLYDWALPSATYGYFIRPDDYFLKGHLLDLARRPTGGGVTFHTHDLAFSFLIPADHPLFFNNTLSSYKVLNQITLRAVSDYVQDEVTLFQDLTQSLGEKEHFCMTKPTIYDLFWRGKKVGGAAQRKRREGVLHQGSLFLAIPSPKELKNILKNGESVGEKMARESASLMKEGLSIDEGRKRVVDSLIRSLSKTQDLC